MEGQTIKPCPFCKSMPESMQRPWHVSCDECMLVGPNRHTEADAIRAWNQIALAFEVARACVLWNGAEGAGDELIERGMTLSAASDAVDGIMVDASAAGVKAMEEWRYTDG